MEDIGREARRCLHVEKVPFSGNILMLGFGAVAQCTLPVLLHMIDVPLSHITVIDMNAATEVKMADWVAKGVRFAVERIRRDNLEAVLAKYLHDGDMLIDLAWEIATFTMLEWCRNHGVLYTNASVETWDPYMDAGVTDPREFTLYHRHSRLVAMINQWPDNHGPTAITDHGANPGLVSHFVKLGLVHISEKILAEKADEDPERTMRITEHLAGREWNKLAQVLGVKVIHISERDTQIACKPKQVNEFVNTWSPEGLYEEGVAPAELGWGTHERTLPEHAVAHPDGSGPQNQILLKTKGMNTFVRSWVPHPTEAGGQDIVGMVIRHGEAYTISDYLTVRNDKGAPVYRPTVHYAYCPSDATVASLQELRMRHYQMSSKCRVLKDEIVSGEDILGCLLMGHDFGAWWIGSMLDIDESRELVPNQNATTVQVAVAVAAGVQWMVKNPRYGVCDPDDLPYDEILSSAFPYLGPFISRPVSWTPLEGIRQELSLDYFRRPVPDDDECWQFNSFLFAAY